MAEFLIGNSLRNVARRHNWLRQLLWALDYALIASVLAIYKILPLDTASRLGYRFGRLIGPVMRKKSAIYRENMTTAFPELSPTELDALVVEAWGRVGMVLAEYMHLETILRDRGGDRLKIEQVEPVVTCQHPDRPVVVVTAHQSNWELACSALARLNMPNSSLYSPPVNPWLDKLLLKSRRALDCELLPRELGPRLLMKALKQGRSAGMVMDRRIDGGPDIEFFGKAKPSTLLPAKLALKNQCDLIPVRVERLHDANFKVTFMPPVKPRNPAASQTEQAVDMIEQVHSQFEDWIRAEPRDWFCSKRIWPKTDTHTIAAATKAAEKSYAA